MGDSAVCPGLRTGGNAALSNDGDAPKEPCSDLQETS